LILYLPKKNLEANKKAFRAFQRIYAKIETKLINLEQVAFDSNFTPTNKEASLQLVEDVFLLCKKLKTVINDAERTD